MDEMDEEESDHQFSDIVNASLHNVGNPLWSRITGYLVAIGILLVIGAMVGILLGACVWVWVSAV